MKLRKSEARGYADHGWLKSFHSFSFADYFDPANMGFRALRVINEDVIDGGGGFPTHPHRDMEIVTYVTAGALEHKDTLGTGAVMRRGEVQRMTAGTGIAHSEFNHSETEAVKLLQIWIIPERAGFRPSYEQRDFSQKLEAGEPVLIASRSGRDESVTIHQDAELWAQRMKGGAERKVVLGPARHAWLQVVSGHLSVKTKSTELELKAGDALAVSDETDLSVKALSPSETLLFDLA